MFLDLTYTAPTMDVDGILNGLLSAHMHASEGVAERIPEVMCARIERGIAPDGTAQKPNSPGWKRRKGGKPPLVWTRKLTNWQRWDVLSTSGTEFSISAPSERTEEVRKLVAQEYKVYVFDDETLAELWDEQWEIELAVFDMAKHITSFKVGA